MCFPAPARESRDNTCVFPQNTRVRRGRENSNPKKPGFTYLNKIHQFLHIVQSHESVDFGSIVQNGSRIRVHIRRLTGLNIYSTIDSTESNRLSTSTQYFSRFPELGQ